MKLWEILEMLAAMVITLGIGLAGLVACVAVIVLLVKWLW